MYKVHGALAGDFTLSNAMAEKLVEVMGRLLERMNL
jgi:hypothetical protein